jgi:ATP-dependent Clp protease ATP-binding subunit ClpA
MMFNRFARDARAVVTNAAPIARGLGSPRIEAEHLLLAVARDDCPAARVLAVEGLDYEGLVAALEREAERSLAAAGVAAETGPFSPWVEEPRFATSAKLALERALRAAAARRDRRLACGHIALGVLRADVGTVPRALQIAGVDRAALSDAIAATIG